jgi:ABC-type uncharacterized transport system involved in gliding motility auxiliary subunit
MATRRQDVLTYSWLSAGLLLVVLVLANVAFGRTAVRVDVTQDRLWTLSEATKQILGSLEDPASIKVFWYKVPDVGDTETDRRYLQSLLDEMRAASHGKLTVRWVNMDSEDGPREAQELQVEAIQTQSIEGSEFRLTDTYQTVVIEHGASEPVKIEPLVHRRDEFEYEIASNLYKMSRTSIPVVGVVAPREQPNPFTGQGGGGRFDSFSEFLRHELGTSARTYLSLDDPIPDDVNVLVVLAPTDLDAKKVFHLDQYALRGGKLLLLLDPVNQGTLDRGTGTTESSGLEDWLAHLGITVEKSVAGDYNSFLRRVKLVPSRRGGRQATLVNDIYWPLLQGQYLDTSNPAMRGFSLIPLFWPAPVAFDSEKTKAAGRSATILATTTPAGYRETDLSRLENFPMNPNRDELHKIPVMLFVEGPAQSFWKGKETPDEAEAKKKQEEEAKKKAEEAKKKAEEEAKKKAEAEKAAGNPDGKPAEAPKDGAKPAPAPSDEKKDDADKKPDGEKKDEAKKDDADKKDDGAKKDEAKKDEAKKDEPKKDEPKGH